MSRRNGNHDLDDVVRDARKSLDQAGQQASRTAQNFRKKAAKQLQQTSDEIRTQLKRSRIDDEAREQIDRMLARVEDVREYLEDGGLEDTLEEVEEKARKAAQGNVWRSLVITFAIGAFIGIVLSRRR